MGCSVSAHTPGRLVADGLVIRGCPDTTDESQVAAAFSPDDARRLVACWNACEGFETASLENILMLGDTMHSRFAALKAECDQAHRELDAARALLVEVIADAGIASHIDACNRAQTFLDARDDQGAPS